MFDLIIKKGMAVLPDAVEMVDIAVKKRRHRSHGTNDRRTGCT